jgi:hypothetical protein
MSWKFIGFMKKGFENHFFILIDKFMHLLNLSIGVKIYKSINF